MKLLIDENISFRILKLLNDDFRGSKHVTDIREQMTDLEIWEYAQVNSFIIVTYDEDFYEWQQLKGYPPKVVWLRIGNAPTKQIAKVLNNKKTRIQKMVSNNDIGLIEIH